LNETDISNFLAFFFYTLHNRRKAVDGNINTEFSPVVLTNHITRIAPPPPLLLGLQYRKVRGEPRNRINLKFNLEYTNFNLLYNNTAKFKPKPTG
jgi:hypothetical protein